MYLATVKYQIGDYSGQINVNSNECDNEYIIARAKRVLRKKTTLSMYYEHYEVTDIKEI